MPIVRVLLASLLLAIAIPGGPASAHQFHSHASPPNSTSEPHSNGNDPLDNAPAAPKMTIARRGPTVDAFAAFAHRVKTSIRGDRLIVESDGLPDHGMMVGIRAWQQQVPIPQPFVGANAWRLPLNPRPADKPISVLTEPMRGAIALAVNGVPIFCALNNRGDDTFLAGELDHWGGHCGRGDDYHYHIAPIHLEEKVGVGNPIAFALDGYPILGLSEADGSTPQELDPFNGHEHDGNYHYHATKKFPYVNGGLYGAVTIQGDQVEQPSDSPFRPGMTPLRGAKITSFERSGNDFDLRYEVSGREGRIQYTLKGGDRAEFKYQDPSGDTRTETYQRGRGRQRSLSLYGWPVAGIVATIGVILFVRRRIGKGSRKDAIASPPRFLL